MRLWVTGHAAVLAAFLAGAVIASAATAGASRLITGKQIKNGTITAKDLSKAVRTQLRKVGPRGAQGLQGLQGAQGLKGDTGQIGQIGPAGAPPAPETTHDIDLGNNGFLGGGHDVPQYFRDLSGVVHLTGVIRAPIGGYGAGTTWVTLPDGYRPAAELAFVAYPVTDTVNAVRFTVVKATGAVTSYTFANAGDYLGLDGVSFRCAPSGANGCP
jgi:hypothetical protein